MMEAMKFYTLDEVKDEFIGVEGTPARDKYEAELTLSFIGDAVRQAREKRHLTQEQLGQLVGVKKGQISKIESGKGVSLLALIRVFKAMGAESANLDLGSMGKVALW